MIRTFRWGLGAFFGLGCLVALFSANYAGSAILAVLAAIAVPRVKKP